MKNYPDLTSTFEQIIKSVKSMEARYNDLKAGACTDKYLFDRANSVDVVTVMSNLTAVQITGYQSADLGCRFFPTEDTSDEK